MILFRGVYLAKNSHAYQLYVEKRFPELIKHIAMTEQKEKDLIEHYDKCSN